jgi:anti-sigma factor RsiW
MPLYLAVRAVLAEGEPVPVPSDVSGLPMPPGRRLVAVVHNGEWQSALDVSHPASYEKLRQRIAEGVWQGLRLYSLAAERVLELADGRRVTMDGLPVPDPGRAALR